MAGTTLAGLVAVPPPLLWSGTPLAVDDPFDRAWLEPYWAGAGAWPLVEPAPPPPQAAAAVRTPVNKARTTSNRFMRPPPDFGGPRELKAKPPSSRGLLMQTKRGRAA